MSEQNQPTVESHSAVDEGAGFVKRLREAWLKTVGNYATDEGETHSLLQRLVGFGTLSAEEAKKVLADARHKIEENRKELDLRVDESIRRAVSPHKLLHSFARRHYSGSRSGSTIL